jgi:VIT1/CCC1 family predicted Fe2+/Mn2+ transporter
MSRFTQRHLDPASRLGEILFGLIMVLTVTLTAGFAVADGRKGVRQLLLAAIGSNVAWGIIDAVMYIMNSMVVRRGKMRLVEAVQRASDPEAALVLIQDGIEPELQELLAPEKAEAFSKSVLRHIVEAQIANRRIVTKEDLYGALACFWLVFVSCLPAAIPFFIFSQPQLALRVSNFLLIAGLFYVGQKWAEYAGKNRLAVGSAMVAVGLTLVGVAILFGG